MSVQVNYFEYQIIYLIPSVFVCNSCLFYSKYLHSNKYIQIDRNRLRFTLLKT